MKQEKKLLLEMPEVLFKSFLKYLGITNIKTFVLKYNNGIMEDVKCFYAPLRRFSEFENPTLVLVDLRPIGVNKVKLILLSTTPRIIDGAIENLDEYGSINVSEINKGGSVTFYLEANTSKFGSIYIGNPFSRFSYLYMIDLVKRCDELFFNRNYTWLDKR
jgi:hypothetical protein